MVGEVILSSAHAEFLDSAALGRVSGWFQNLAKEIITQVTAMGDAKIAELVANPAELTALLTTALTACGLGDYATLIVPILEPMVLAALRAMLPAPTPVAPAA